ncbi:MAG: hypothetical protein K0B11_02105 [Mariniphaga sp.]|nr:hypothetical protein [Mariniphaga sp.]
MKRLLLFTLSLLLLLSFLFVMKKWIDLPQDLYPLSDSLYLEKVDYFSNYSLLKKTNDDYEKIITSISKINRISNIIICFSNSTKEYFVITDNAEVQKFNNIESINNQYNLSEITLLSPWQFIEKYKKHDFFKTIREIIVILIILLIILLFRELIVKLKSKNV